MPNGKICPVLLHAWIQHYGQFDKLVGSWFDCCHCADDCGLYDDKHKCCSIVSVSRILKLSKKK